MAEGNSNLIRKRGVIKRKLTMFQSFLTPLNESLKGGKEISAVEILKLEKKLHRFEGIINDFDVVQTNIEYSCEEKDLEQHYAERDRFDSEYDTSLTNAKAILAGSSFVSIQRDPDNVNQVNEIDPPSGDESESLSNSGSNSGLSQSNKDENLLQGVKLPTIELPKYSGSHTNWLEFRDTFQSLIHNNLSINNIQKYHYLRATLEGEALKIIQSLEFTSSNYETAWDLICKRFDNPRLLVHNHVKSIFEMEAVTRESARGLRNVVDTVNKHLRSLSSLGQPTDYWDTLLIYIVLTKLDKCSAHEWEKYKNKLEFPTLDNLQSFLNSRADLLETIEVNHGSKTSNNNKFQKHDVHFDNRNRKVSFLATNLQCYNCKGAHRIYNCESFISLSIPDRIAKVTKLNLCRNCLNLGHSDKQCYSGGCRICGKNHNTLTHLNSKSTEASPQVTLSNQTVSNDCVLLSTVSVYVLDAKGITHKAKMLLDSCSQSNYITTNLCNKLGLKMIPTNHSVVGINQATTLIKSGCSVELKSIHDDFSMNISCLVLPKITERLPFSAVNISSAEIPNIRLADPTFYEPSSIDLLIGAGHFFSLLSNGQIKLNQGKLILQNTVFGWIISGQLGLPAPTSSSVCNFSQTLDVLQNLQKFWEVEEYAQTSNSSNDDLTCEKHFTENLSRDTEGRFIVKIPLKYSETHLGDSKSMALKRFKQLENKLQTQPSLRKHYSDFMREYQQLGHMSIKALTREPELEYFLPHHGVLRNESLTTKLRVVFDGSAITTSGWSVNDLQYTGPCIINDILSILLRFRQHKFVVSADVAKMFRQILVHSDQRHLQQIVWRDDPDKKLETFTLNTVTYGMVSSPYLANRCIKQLSIDFKETFPESANIIGRDFYVDDLITGFSTEQEAIQRCQEISNILNSVKFPLRKWNSNNVNILDSLQDESEPLSVVNLGETDQSKTLGIRWITKSDILTYQIKQPLVDNSLSKRSILSDISKIYDPLGLLSPCVILAKIIIQKLWSLKVDWDDDIPPDLGSKWLHFRNKLPLLNSLKIDRCVIANDAVSYQLHGFCDASESAYGACIYIRSVDQQDNVTVKLLCAKTKVAPLKSLTIPRLELCSALLLGKLMKRVCDSLTLSAETFLWSDSQIVLHWINTDPHLLQTFVRNRISNIQELYNSSHWNYINTKENPADLSSRGTFPDSLLNSTLWWHGPQWLTLSNYHWPKPFYKSLREIPEIKITSNTFISVDHNSFLFDKFSSLPRLKRVTAYILRFVNNAKLPKHDRQKGPLTVVELDSSMKLLIRLAQQDSFSAEISLLQSNRPLSDKNKLLGLSPFLDSEGLIRVGGRLKHANLKFEAKHPLLIGGKHILSKLIMEHEHKALLHAGPQLLLTTVRQTFWPTSGMNLAKKVTRNCLRCYKFNPSSVSPFMANLPKDRVIVSHPFSTTGIDYAGPFILRDRKGRGAKFYKSYICLFICFASKAIHLEVVTDLTAENFISTFRRFTSRRGKPSQVYSDNGTNFVGAKGELEKLQHFLKQAYVKISEHCANEGISWKFIPPKSPHFGGIWEENIRQVKYHLSRVLGETRLIYEEFTTIVYQIEAILNSRPLYPMSSDPNDYQPLTPSHFLVGRPLIMIPDPSLNDIPLGRLSRFQLLQKLNQDFWRAWSRDYLNYMQQRTKWRQQHRNIDVGTLVLLRNDNLPACQWALGRISEVYPDADGVVRVVNVKTPRGSFKRAVVKVCPLPMEEDSPKDNTIAS